MLTAELLRFQLPGEQLAHVTFRGSDSALSDERRAPDTGSSSPAPLEQRSPDSSWISSRLSQSGSARGDFSTLSSGLIAVQRRFLVSTHASSTQERCSAVQCYAMR